MKKSILIAIVFLPLLSFGQTCFTNGMEWRTQLVNTADPEGKGSVEISSLEEPLQLDGYDALKMYRMNENEPSSKAMGYYIRTDNDKVFFKPQGTTSDAWYLMYDFGLAAGQGCYVYSPVFVDDGSKPLRLYVKCVGVGKSDASDACLMDMEEFRDESCRELLGRVKWLKGISSEMGVDYNIGSGMDGFGALLLDVKQGNNVVFSRATASISDVSSATLKYHVDGLNLVVSGVTPSDKIQIYQPDGKPVGIFTVSDDKVTVRLPQKGLYIFKSGNNMRAVVVPVN